MHVTIVPADRTGCGQYRLVWPGQAVSLVRPDWTVEIRGGETVEVGFHGDELVGVRGLDPLPDVLVMQRVGTRGQLALLRWASEQGVATVVDFDDAMWAVDKDNTAWRSWNAANPWGQHWRVCEEAAQVADLVTVTTDGLARHYGRRHGRTQVIPNRVPLAATLLPEPEPNERFTAGWAGFTATHPGDCRTSGSAARAVLTLGGRLRVVADAPGAAAEWGVDPSLVESVGPQKFGPAYYGALASLDLMLVGLQDTPFNQCKSTLKVLEAGAGGVPAVAPANRPHRALKRTGYPVTLAESDAEWRMAAALHAEMSPDALARYKQEIRGLTREHHTIEGNADEWAGAWQRAYDRKSRT